MLHLRLLWGILAWGIVGCQASDSSESSISSALLTAAAPEAGLTQHLKALPFSVQCRFLPASNLDPAHSTDFSGQASAAVPSQQALTFHLQLQAADPQRSVTELIAAAAPAGTSAEQIQQELLYRFDRAGHLQVGSESIPALSATVEMTADAAHTLSIILVFPVTTRQLRENSALAVVLDKAFFLPAPLTFSFNSAAVLAAQQQQ